jgi:hypothetical protein
MRRFFFDVDIGGSQVRDATGVEVASLAGVREELVSALYALFRDRAGVEDDRVFKIKVRDDQDVVIMTASLTLEVRTFRNLDHATNGSAG